VELAELQDAEVGDGTTSVVILAAELLKRANELVRNRIHPTNIIGGYRLAMREVGRSVWRGGSAASRIFVCWELLLYSPPAQPSSTLAYTPDAICMAGEWMALCSHVVLIGLFGAAVVQNACTCSLN